MIHSRQKIKNTQHPDTLPHLRPHAAQRRLRSIRVNYKESNCYCDNVLHHCAPAPGDVMPLYWLVYRLNNQISVVIEPTHSLIYARLRASLDGLDEGEFTDGPKWRSEERRVGKERRAGVW